MDLENLKIKFEENIRVGKIIDVKNQLEKLPTSIISREYMVAFADIARRVRSEIWGLRLLRPIVRSEKPKMAVATENELCAYAGLLIKVGALSEAENILRQLNSEKNLDINTFLSQIHILRWNYKAAAEQLRKNLTTATMPVYHRCVTEVNLASAYIFLEKPDQAKKLLSKILEICKQHNWDLLYGNALELSAQQAVLQKNWLAAKDLLKQSEQHAGQHSHYLIFIEKWRCLIDLLSTTPGTDESDLALKQVEEVRKKAKTLQSWETARDLDYYVARYLNHKNLLLHVYFGTPYVDYKKRIEKICQKNKWEIPDSYYRKLSPAPALRVLDLESGREENVDLKSPLKPGQMLHRFLNILAADFYKPIGAGELFSKLFVEEYYNPDTSLERVSQATKQLRQWFVTNEVPLDLSVENSKYQLFATGPYALKVLKQTLSSKDLLESGFEDQLKRLKINWPYKSFSVSQASQFLKISLSSVRSTLKKALKDKRLFQSGSARSTLYRFEK